MAKTWRRVDAMVCTLLRRIHLAMRTGIRLLALSACGSLTCASAAEKLVIELNLDSDLLSLVHQVDKLPFPPTMNFSPHVAGNLSERMKVSALQNQLILSALVLCRFFDSDLGFVLRGVVFIALGAGFLFTNFALLRRKRTAS